MQAASKTPKDLATIVAGLALAYKLYEEARPLVVEVVDFLKGKHPEHAAGIEAVATGQLPTELQQNDLDNAVLQVKALDLEKRLEHEHTSSYDGEFATIDPEPLEDVPEYRTKS